MVTEIRVSMLLETQNLFFFFLSEMCEIYGGIYDKKRSVIFIKTILKR